MKTTLIAAALLILAVPTWGQRRGGGMAPSTLVSSGGGTGGGGLASASFSSAPIIRSPHYEYVFARGSESTYVPSTFVEYSKALEMGKAALAYRPKTIAEVAAEYRALKEKRQKPTVTSAK